MPAKIRSFQWPNVLAVDASVIALAWLWVLADAQSLQLSPAAYIVLALSVWLTYTSDRLLDVARRGERQLLSLRHQFAKRHMLILGLVWTVLLSANIAIALTGLSESQLQKGFVLLFVCLAYTGFHHRLSRRFFPKEPIVALIFAGGTQVFLSCRTQWGFLAGFALLCLLNCLLIGWKEKPIDTMLEVRSLSSILDDRWAYALLAVGAALSLRTNNGSLILLPSFIVLGGIHFYRKRLHTECFRVFCDATLLFGPIVYFVASKL